MFTDSEPPINGLLGVPIIGDPDPPISYHVTESFDLYKCHMSSLIKVYN